MVCMEKSNGEPPPSQNPPQPPTPKPSKDKPTLKGSCSLSHLHLKAGRLNHPGQLAYACGLSANPLNPPQELLALPWNLTGVLEDHPFEGTPQGATHSGWLRNPFPTIQDPWVPTRYVNTNKRYWLPTHGFTSRCDFRISHVASEPRPMGPMGPGPPWPAAIDPTACVAEKSTRCTATSSSFSRLSCLPRPKASGSGGSPWKFPSNTPPRWWILQGEPAKEVSGASAKASG